MTTFSGIKQGEFDHNPQELIKTFPESLHNVIIRHFVFSDGCIYALKRSKKPVAGSIDEYVYTA
jgi:hypothetical protein